jgi:hypothetical protein
MKFIKLLSSAYVAGRLRHPHEGAIPVEDKEATRLVDDEKVAEDVTDDFTADQIAEAQPEPITAAPPSPPVNAETAAEQPQATTEKPSKTQAAKPASTKE